MDYIINHWRGKFPLSQAFWINLIAGLVAICLVEYFLHQFTAFNFRDFSILAIIYFVIFHLIVFTWQSVGVLRACDHNIKNYISSGWTRSAQFIVITCFAATLIWGVTLGQDLWRLKIDEQNRQAGVDISQNFNLTILEPASLGIEGVLNPGITREVNKLLAGNAQINTIELNSMGGNIFEARGLAKTIKDNNLNTHTTKRCFSSCTTVFIAGEKRTLADSATLGFHQYKINSKKLLAPNVNVEKEQQKDLDFFLKQGVSEEFLNKAFSIPFESMWQPSRDELQQAGIINE